METEVKIESFLINADELRHFVEDMKASVAQWERRWIYRISFVKLLVLGYYIRKIDRTIERYSVGRRKKY